MTNERTFNQIRDRIARWLGWKYEVHSRSTGECWITPDGEPYLSHPISPDANGLLAAWAAISVGWTWQRKRRGDGAFIWIAERGMKGYGGDEVSVADTSDEVSDRFRLIDKVLDMIEAKGASSGTR